jgi:hypothetical protein
MFYRQRPEPSPDSQPSQPRTKTRGSVSQPDFAVLLRFCSSTQTRSTFPTTLKDNGYVNLPGKILLTRASLSSKSAASAEHRYAPIARFVPNIRGKCSFRIRCAKYINPIPLPTAHDPPSLGSRTRFCLPLPLVLLIRRGCCALEVAVAFLVVIPEGDLLAHVPLQFQHPHSKQSETTRHGLLHHQIISCSDHNRIGYP